MRENDGAKLIPPYIPRVMVTPSCRQSVANLLHQLGLVATTEGWSAVWEGLSNTDAGTLSVGLAEENVQ